MRKPEKKEEWLIQRKVDGTLSAQEEEEFSDLIKKSPDARSFYQGLITLHHAMRNDSKSIPSVDFSFGIMHRLKEKQRVPVPVMTKLFGTAGPRTFLAYAAVLLTGLLIGIAGTYLSNGPGDRPSADKLSGTMVETDVLQGYYSKHGTEIKITRAEQQNFRLLTFALTTGDPIEVTINCRSGKPGKEQLSLLFSEGLFQFAGERGDKRLYRCTGQHIFQLSDNNSANSLNVTFSRNNRIFYELNQ